MTDGEKDVQSPTPVGSAKDLDVGVDRDYPADMINAVAKQTKSNSGGSKTSAIEADTQVTSAEVEQAFEKGIAELAAALGKRRGPRIFSENAVRELTIQQANFLEDVGLDAINLARRSQADVVSAADVRSAEASLRSRGPSFPSRLLEPVGGLLAGAGLAQLYSVLSAAKTATPSTLAYLLAALSTMAGIGLLAFGLARRG